jgi:hypothetical protein
MWPIYAPFSLRVQDADVGYQALVAQIDRVLAGFKARSKRSKNIVMRSRTVFKDRAVGEPGSDRHLCI